MKWFKVADGRMEPAELGQLSFGQVQQTAALADCLGRLIPQEGVDYDVHIILKEPTGDEKAQHKTPTRVSMQIVALTEKGEWWKRYVGAPRTRGGERGWRDRDGYDSTLGNPRV